jgi:hypothetical protein
MSDLFTSCEYVVYSSYPVSSCEDQIGTSVLHKNSVRQGRNNIFACIWFSC